MSQSRLRGTSSQKVRPSALITFSLHEKFESEPSIIAAKLKAGKEEELILVECRVYFEILKVPLSLP